MRRFTIALVALAGLLVVGLTGPQTEPATAADYTWDGGAGAGDLNWSSALNWNHPTWPDTVPVNNAADRVNLGTTVPIIDVNGYAVNLPDMTVFMGKQGFTLQDTAGTGSITAKVFQVQCYGASFYPAITAGTLLANYRVAGINYYDTVDTGTIDLTSGYHTFYGNVTATTEVKIAGGTQGDGNIYLKAQGANPAASLTTPKITVSGGSSYSRSRIEAGGLVDVDNVTVTSGGKYFAQAANSIGDASTVVTLDKSGLLQLVVAQTAFPKVNVNAYGILYGDMTGADFTPSTGNVTLAEDAVYVPTVDAVAPPTQANTGLGAVVWEGFTSAKSVYTSGNDGTNIFKGPAVGYWSAATLSGFTVNAQAGSGPVKFLIASTRNEYETSSIGSGTIWNGSDNTVADITVRNGDAEVKLQLNNALNSGVDYTAPDNKYVRTFNVIGQVGKETRPVLVANANNEMIRAEQTFNASNGNVSGSWGGNMHGTLNVTNGFFSTSTTFDANDGYLALHGTAVLSPNATAFEALGDHFSYDADARLVVESGAGAYDYDASPVMADILTHADYTRSGYSVQTIVGDRRIGHGKYVIAAWDQTNANGYTTATGARFLSANNAPAGVTPTIGFAASISNMPIGLEVYAPEAIVVCGSDDPTRIPYRGTGGITNVLADKTVTFQKAVTAAGVRLLSGTATFNLDLVTGTIEDRSRNPDHGHRQDGQRLHLGERHWQVDRRPWPDRRSRREDQARHRHRHD